MSETAPDAEDPRSLLERQDNVAALQDYLDRAIPLITHMGIRVTRVARDGVRLSAPLGPNRNHIGTAFGGSLHGLATLASWGLLWLLLRETPGMEIVVRESRMRYTAPARSDLEAFCPTPNPGMLGQFFRNLERRGKAGLELPSRVECREEVCADFEGSFVALRKG